MLVVGAGVVGLAVARHLARSRARRVTVADAAPTFGTGVSSRSSNVVHAGVYYAAGSLKARACVSGRRELVEFARAAGVPLSVCGKLIVATSADQVPALRGVLQRAVANGVREGEEIRLVTREEALAMEPELACQGAVHSACTGVVDAHALMAALLSDAGEGVETAFNTRVAAVRARGARGGFEVDVEGQGTPGAGGDTVTCATLVNCAGLHAPELARRTVTGAPAHDARVPRASFFCKGSYFRLARRRAPFSRLVYPLPEAHGLGVHLTLDLVGGARFGPDVQWVDSPSDLGVDASRAGAFYAEIRKYFPGLREGELEPDYAGIRPKLGPASEPARDFWVWGPREHGVRGLVHVLGVESPGLTSSLALARVVGEELRGESASLGAEVAR